MVAIWSLIAPSFSFEYCINMDLMLPWAVNIFNKLASKDFALTYTLDSGVGPWVKSEIDHVAYKIKGNEE